jgi:hypothetical protein
VNANLWGDLFWLIGWCVLMICGTAIIVTLIRTLDD